MKKVHMIGIAGVGMSGLAQLLWNERAYVTGSDNARFPTLDAVEKLGIPVTIGYDAANVPGDAELVIHSDAVPEHNPERARARELHIPDKSYFEVLGNVSKDKRTIAVAGTHGKTTTTGMLAKILIDAKRSPTVIVGSIMKDFQSNYVAGTSNLFVVEACEYRDHLLELSPEVLVVTNLEWDHTDYFSSLKALQNSFRTAIERVPAHGVIVTNPSNSNIAPLLDGVKAKVVDYTKEAAYELRLPGVFNQENARAAAAAARAVHPDLSDAVIERALGDFHGAWRRFEYKGTTENGADVYDDYAHHPTAVKGTIAALREKANGRVFVAFHPHLFSRTKDLFDDFTHAFADADKVYIAPIYAAREENDGSVSSEMLADALRKEGVVAEAATFDEIEQKLENEAHNGDVIMTMGAGDIFKVADALVQK